MAEYDKNVLRLLGGLARPWKCACGELVPALLFDCAKCGKTPKQGLVEVPA